MSPRSSRSASRFSRNASVSVPSAARISRLLSTVACAAARACSCQAAASGAELIGGQRDEPQLQFFKFDGRIIEACRIGRRHVLRKSPKTPMQVLIVVALPMPKRFIILPPISREFACREPH
jgi:hypothetical protein